MKRTDENKVKYLEMLQAVITRMNGNCFAIKNWFIVCFGGLLTLYLTKGTPVVMLIGVLIAIVFGTWDAYYLWLERKYRDKYDDARSDKAELFDMNPFNSAKEKKRRSCLLSLSMLPYWVAMVVALVLLNYQNIRLFANCVSQCIYGDQVIK